MSVDDNPPPVPGQNPPPQPAAETAPVVIDVPIPGVTDKNFQLKWEDVLLIRNGLMIPGPNAIHALARDWLKAWEPKPDVTHDSDETEENS